MDIKQLYDKWNNWIFDEATRVIELLSALGLMLFSIVFYFNNNELLLLPSYRKFNLVAPPEIWFIIFIIGLSQLIAALLTSNKSSQLSGYILMLSGFIWAWVAITFNLDTEFITTGSIIYGLLAIFCSLSGLRQLSKFKFYEDNNKYEVH